jgi:hypothetical protein
VLIFFKPKPHQPVGEAREYSNVLHCIARECCVFPRERYLTLEKGWKVAFKDYQEQEEWFKSREYKIESGLMKVIGTLQSSDSDVQ